MSRTITRPQFEALRTAEPYPWKRFDALDGRRLLSHRVRSNTVAVLVRLGLVELVEVRDEEGEVTSRAHCLTPAGELIAAPLENGGRLVSLDYIASAVKHSAEETERPAAEIIAEHKAGSSEWAEVPEGMAVSFLTGTTKRRGTFRRRTGVVSLMVEERHGNLIFRHYWITEDGTGESHRINSGRVRVLDEQPTTAQDAPQDVPASLSGLPLPIVTTDELLALLEPVPVPSRATYQDRTERPHYVTANGYVIVPGMSVEDYDRRTDGVIGRRQFERGGVCDPGGQYWDGWFEVEYPSGTVRKFNGERMRALIPQH
jgi:hypothetical protein